MTFLLVCAFIIYGFIGLIKVVSDPKMFWLLVIVGLFLLAGQWWAVIGLFFFI